MFACPLEILNHIGQFSCCTKQNWYVFSQVAKHWSKAVHSLQSITLRTHVTYMDIPHHQLIQIRKIVLLGQVGISDSFFSNLEPLQHLTSLTIACYPTGEDRFLRLLCTLTRLQSLTLSFCLFSNSELHDWSKSFQYLNTLILINCSIECDFHHWQVFYKLPELKKIQFRGVLGQVKNFDATIANQVTIKWTHVEYLISHMEPHLFLLMSPFPSYALTLESWTMDDNLNDNLNDVLSLVPDASTHSFASLTFLSIPLTRVFNLRYLSLLPHLEIFVLRHCGFYNTSVNSILHYLTNCSCLRKIGYTERYGGETLMCDFLSEDARTYSFIREYWLA